MALWMAAFVLLASRGVLGEDDACMLQVDSPPWSPNRLDCSSGTSLANAGLEVVTPRADEYDDKRQQYASQMGSEAEANLQTRPRLIVFCNTEEHVQHAVNFARGCGYKVTVRSGGHQYGALSSCPRGQRCMQLDVSGLDKFEYDANDDFVTLGVGLRLGDVYGRLATLGVTLPLGICNTVGVGGHLQSSSMGLFARAEGLGMDHVVAFSIVLADGSLHRVDRDSAVGCEGKSCEKNLYWAALGGSPGSWGVILDYTLRPVHASTYPHSANGYWFWPYQHQLFVELSQVVMEIHADPRFERDFSGDLIVEPQPELAMVPELQPVHGGNPLTHYIKLDFHWFGRDTGAMTPAIQAQLTDKFVRVARPIMEAMGLPYDFLPLESVIPHYGKMYQASMPEMMVATAMNWTQVPGYRYHVHGFAANHWYTEDFIEAVAHELDTRIKDHPTIYSSFQWLPQGGGQGNGGKGSQLNRNGDGRNAYPIRDLAMHVDDWIWFPDDQAQVAKHIVEKFHESSKKYWHSFGSANQAFMTIPTWMQEADYHRMDKFRDYYPSREWYRSLVDVKTQVDPSDIFSSGMTIPPRGAAGR